MCGDKVERLIPGEMEEELLILNEDLKRVISTKINLINSPLKEMISSGGKRLRPALMLACARFGEYDFEKVKPLALAVELIHTATLVHDDIIDDSPLRRGIPSIQSRLGKDVAVFAGDFIFCRVFELLTSLNDFNILRRTSKVMYKICEGEIKQREDLFRTDITFRNYIYRIQRKTALLFGLSCELGALATNAPLKTVRALYGYGIKIGTAFQLIDDLLDVIGDEKNLGKPAGADIREGVVTLPTLYALTYSPKKDELKNILQNKNLTIEDTKKAIKIIKDSGGVEYTVELTKRYIYKAYKFIDILADIPMKKVLKDVADYIYSRNH
ncbi:polyprenyl synthetase family protein [Biomaibacter acetigenes]|jgi:heptaprenyl diphosphate synthase|uniref:Polyprenyl synthetase family protein n=1 Tax=Biomaibacter acetigenes TaxID=2316383 RepID=A0A3G2R6U9_9FIRM|nr:polyprenyl synthetase family protein [Biomaibacter acetigenes]MDN5313545.1 hypothetical protein [Thermoanaerobacteraceae bacterium]RKL63551.1 polyprenyl synthetase family protein [Thermoanaerobacteraceae bacterium SP2]